MDLSEFIAKTLISIRQGISEANKQTGNAYKIHPEAKVVNFDIAVEIGKEDSSEKKGGVAIKVVEGSMSGSSKSKESNITRINFTVGVNTSLT